MKKKNGSRVCHQYFLSNRQPPFICQFVLPKNVTSLEAARLCAFIRTLASDFKADK